MSESRAASSIVESLRTISLSLSVGLSRSALLAIFVLCSINAPAVAGKAAGSVSVVQATQDVGALARIGKGDVAIRSVSSYFVPVDAVTSPQHAVGRYVKFKLRRGETVPVHALASGPPAVVSTLPNLRQELRKRTRELNGADQRSTGVVVYVTRGIQAGGTISSSVVQEHRVPVRCIPRDSISASTFAVGMRARFGLSKGQLLSLYDLSL